MSHQRNITRIKAVSNALAKLETPVVFAGGAAVSLYVDASFREEVRPTDDVDVVIEIAAYKNYAAMEERLRSLGFANDMTSKIICRYQYRGIIVDIMPTDESILGFSNKWYAPGYKMAMDVEIDKNHTVKIFPVEYFIASKLDAFKDRGKNDGRTSTDFEDIVFVLNYRSAVWEELANSPVAVKTYLLVEFKKLTAGPYFYEWISSHLGFDEQNRVGFIIGNLERFLNREG
jgi:predicted nucleotidyltransferase